jgi:hypothetical protein
VANVQSATKCSPSSKRKTGDPREQGLSRAGYHGASSGEVLMRLNEILSYHDSPLIKLIIVWGLVMLCVFFIANTALWVIVRFLFSLE